MRNIVLIIGTYEIVNKKLWDINSTETFPCFMYLEKDE